MEVGLFTVSAQALDLEIRMQKAANPLTSVAAEKSQIRELELDLQKTLRRFGAKKRPPEIPATVSQSTLCVRDPEQRNKAGETGSCDVARSGSPIGPEI